MLKKDTPKEKWSSLWIRTTSPDKALHLTNIHSLDNVCPLIPRKKMSGEHSFPFPLVTPSQGRATLTICREHERTVRVAFKKGAEKMNATKITTGMDTNVKLLGSDRGSLVADPTEGSTTMNSPKRLARIAGVLYLPVGIFGGFAEGFVEPKMYVAGNAAATAGNVVANSALVRLGVVADLFNATVFV